MKKQQLLNALKRITPSAKLPSQIDFELSNDCLYINISERGVVANMQEDKSAFEGWSIVIKAAIPTIKRVILDWSNPMYLKGKESTQKAHHNRFVMRAANFRKAYEWFGVAEQRKTEVDNIQNLLESKTLVVNFPQKPIRPLVDKEKDPEAYLERKLVELWSKTIPITDEQLPVGIFMNNIVSIPSTLTPGRKSQIDLWQLYEKTMHIYELKVRGNESIGIISELMFYACTMQNIVNGLIKYPDLTKEKPLRHIKDFADAVTNNEIDVVKGYFTATKFHPLIESQQMKQPIKDILNDNTFGIEFDYMDTSNIML